MTIPSEVILVFSHVFCLFVGYRFARSRSSRALRALYHTHQLLTLTFEELEKIDNRRVRRKSVVPSEPKEATS